MRAVSVGLFRHQNGTFYRIQKSAGKQEWRSLGTTDKRQALRLLVDQMDVKIEPVEQFPTFKEVSNQWLQSISHTIKPTTYEWRWRCLLALYKKFGDLTLDVIKPSDVEAWMHGRLKHASPTTANYELNTVLTTRS